MRTSEIASAFQPPALTVSIKEVRHERRCTKMSFKMDKYTVNV